LYRARGSSLTNGMLKCSAELSRPENAGLEKAISFLENIKKSTDEAAIDKGGPISWADLIHIAGMYCRKARCLSVQIVTLMRYIASWKELEKNKILRLIVVLDV
jgi:catalase (peroxidase I)